MLPAMTRHHHRSRTVRTVPYHGRFARAAVTQGASCTELCTAAQRPHERANMGGCDNLVVVQSDLTAAAGQTRPAPSPDMPAGHVRWATRVLWLGYDAQRPPQCHNQPHMPDQRPCEPHYRSRARAVAALVGLGRAGVHFDRLGQRRAMVRDLIGLVID